jgi:hypothetical protein
MVKGGRIGSQGLYKQQESEGQQGDLQQDCWPVSRPMGTTRDNWETIEDDWGPTGDDWGPTGTNWGQLGVVGGGWGMAGDDW